MEDHPGIRPLIRHSLQALIGLLIGAITLPAQAAARPDPIEAPLLEAIDLLRTGDGAQARKRLRPLLAQHPNFHLARWLHDELPAVDCETLGEDTDDAAETSERGLQAEACLRLAARALRPAQGWLPDVLVRSAPETRRVVVVDLSLARLYLFRADGTRFRLIREHYAALGRRGFGKQEEGDLRTPLGLYRITQWLDGRRLPPLYGAGALTLDYPNDWDIRQARSGTDIWLHGVPPDRYVRPPHSSEGCVTMANEDLRALAREVRNGETLVVLSHRLHWLAPDDFAAAQQHVLTQLQDWRDRYASFDFESYQQHYSARFRSEENDPYSFMLHKRAIESEAAPPAPRLSALAVTGLPDATQMLMRADFTLTMAKAQVRRLRQYWRLEPDGWRILHETLRP